MIVSEVPGFAPDILGGGSEHGTLDGHATVGGVVVPRGEQALDRQAEQHDPARVTIEVPARHFVGRLLGRHRADLEAHFLQLGPGAAEELHGGADGQIEPVDPPFQGSERRPDDLAAAEPPVTTVPCTAPGSGGGAGCASTLHDESLGVPPGPRRGIRSPSSAARTLAEMDGRLCSKVACAREAVATITYEYGDKMAALGPLGAANHPHAHDLCSPHADRVSVPAGWLIVRHEALRA